MSDDPALLSRSLNSDASRTSRDGLPVYRQLPSSTLTQPADLELSVSIELGRVRMRMADVLQLAEGCVLALDKSTDEPVDVVINDQVVARGEVVVLNGKFAVRVLQVVSTVEPTQG